MPSIFTLEGPDLSLLGVGYAQQAYSVPGMTAGPLCVEPLSGPLHASESTGVSPGLVALGLGAVLVAGLGLAVGLRGRKRPSTLQMADGGARAWDKAQVKAFAKDARKRVSDGWRLLVPELQEAVVASEAMRVIMSQHSDKYDGVKWLFIDIMQAAKVPGWEERSID